MSCEFKEKTQWYCENFEKIIEVEEHISNCEECRKLLDDSTQSIELPREDIADENTNLLKKVLKRKKEAKRILIFSIIGMIMGFFSYKYIDQNIFILKLILAVPYKLMEMVMLYIRPQVTNIFSFNDYMGYMGYMHSSIFLKFWVLNATAERVLPCIIGGCIYGSIGYITGDKNVLTLKKFIAFISKWVVAAVLCVGLLFGTYYYVSDATYSFEDISGFMVSTSSNGTVYNGSTGVYNDRYSREFENLVEGLSNSKKTDVNLSGGDYSHMMPVTILGKLYFEVTAMLDIQNNLLYLDNGDVYQVPQSFVDTCINIEK